MNAALDFRLKAKAQRLQGLVVCLILPLLIASVAHTEVIEFPEDELATESVLPVFDQPVGVKNRSVNTAHRFELGVEAGYDMTEPFFSPYTIGGSATYHFNEESGLNILGTYFFSHGTTGYVNQLNNVSGSATQLNLQYAPGPKWMLLANYQYTGFYGKLSFTKSAVMNFSLFGVAGLGGFEIGDKIEPVVDVGIGQKFYFNSNWAIRVDLLLLVYQGPNIITTSLTNVNSTQPTSAFATRTFFGTMISLAGVYLIPNS